MTRLTKDEIEFLDRLPLVLQTPLPVFVDGGGGHGDWTAAVLERFPNGIVYLFEPHPLNFALCRERFAACLGVYCFQTALSDITEKNVAFWVDPDVRAFGSSLYHRAHHFDMSIAVQTVMLGALHPTPVDMVKLDLEGGELRALGGLGELRPDIIQFEHGDPWLDAGATYQEAHDLLRAMGYDIDGDAPQPGEFKNVIAWRAK